MNAAQRRDGAPLAYAESLLSMLALELMRAGATNQSAPPPAPDVSAARFELVLQFIEEHLGSHIALQDLASLAALSVSHFSHAFKATYGVAPYRYIAQRRIERAKILLRTTTDTVASVAATVGFSSQSRFTHLFARTTGFTPSAYRSGAPSRSERYAGSKLPLWARYDEAAEVMHAYGQPVLRVR
jgi:AraC family transcriptional regulator